MKEAAGNHTEAEPVYAELTVMTRGGRLATLIKQVDGGTS